VLHTLAELEHSLPLPKGLSWFMRVLLSSGIFFSNKGYRQHLGVFNGDAAIVLQLMLKLDSLLV
jgi:hypothetical protein